MSNHRSEKNNQRQAQATRLSDKQAMTCIYSDKGTESIFQDIQAVYNLKMIEAKEFLRVMNTAKSCSELKKNLRTLRQQIVAKFPTGPMKSPTTSQGDSNAGSSASNSSNAPYSYGSGTTGGSSFNSVPYDPPFPGEYYPPPAVPYGPSDAYGFPEDDEDLDF